MTTPYTRPPKLRVREYFDSLTHPEQDDPLPLEEIRRQLGWRLLPNNDDVDRE
jgi:hypothetical protein